MPARVWRGGHRTKNSILRCLCDEMVVVMNVVLAGMGVVWVAVTVTVTGTAREETESDE